VNVPFVAIVSYVGVCASAPRASKTRIATHIITAIAFEDVILRDVAVRARRRGRGPPFVATFVSRPATPTLDSLARR
jgi:hypothetical protein